MHFTGCIACFTFVFPVVVRAIEVVVIVTGVFHLSFVVHVLVIVVLGVAYVPGFLVVICILSVFSSDGFRVFVGEVIMIVYSDTFF